jgi:hypothetical protein
MPNFNHKAFSKLIKAEGRVREFNFRRKSGIEGPIYEVDVSDHNGHRHYFSMKKINDDWTISEPFLPSWIVEVLPLLVEIIAEQEL